MKRHSHTRALLAVLGVALLTIIGCGGAATAPAASAAPSAAPAASAAAASPAGPAVVDLAALEKAARAEGAITVYTVQTAGVNTALKKGFETKYPGITVSILSLQAAEMKPKWTAEVQSGQILADTITFGEHTILDQTASALAPLSDLPAWQAYPEKYRTANTVLTSINVRHVMINTSKVKPGDITKWTDITNPKWKGQLVMADPKSTVTVGTFYTELSKRFGDDFLRGLAAQQPNFLAGGGPQSALIASGEKAIAFPVAGQSIAPLIAQGAPVAALQLDPTSGSEIWTSMMAKAKHPNAARLMMNYIVTRDGQQALNGGGLGSSVLADIPTTEPLPKVYLTVPETITTAETARLKGLLGSP